MLLHLEIPIGGSVKKVGPNVFVCLSVCLSVCLCVQAFRHVAHKRMDRSGWGWHRSMHQSAGTMIVPVAGWPTPRATCHVAPGRPMHEIFCQGCRSNGGRLGCPVFRSHGPHREPRSCLVSGCTVHVPEAKHVFDKGFSDSVMEGVL